MRESARGLILAHKLTIEARLCFRESCGMKGGLEGETGGEIERSCTLAGVDKDAEREARRFCPTWCADEARPRCPNTGSVNLLASLSISWNRCREKTFMKTEFIIVLEPSVKIHFYNIHVA